MNILGIDIGGTKTIAGVADESGRLLAYKRIETPGVLGPDINLAAIGAACEEVVAQAGVGIDSVGIGCGGPLDQKTGALLQVPNLPGWDGIVLKDVFGSRLGVPAFIDNDATAACLGELKFGAGKGIDDFVYFTVSTGIGGGIVIGGKLYRGHGGNAGEFGHMKIIADGGPKCTCGDNGCLESLCSGTSIARIAQEKWGRSPSSALREGLCPYFSAELVAKAAKDGDELALSVWSEAMHYLGIGVANVVNAFNPRLVIIGGGVTKAGDMFFGPIREEVRSRAMPPLAADVQIVPAANGDLTGLMGAVAVAMAGQV
jgi:glucokinase